MNPLQMNIAVARGEALGAHLLASAALQAIFMMTSNREQLLAGITAFIDDTLNRAGPNKGDPDDAFNTRVRETARFHTGQCLDTIAQMIRTQPKSS